ncbi:MAG TPA: hypothetical protein PK163_07920, partial [Steroidobacteraceae bacterium]|nr:hypothetical protein [Steroidobacteraceae bacterium]
MTQVKGIQTLAVAVAVILAAAAAQAADAPTAASAAAPAPAANSLESALTGGKVHFDFRYRFEDVDQQSFL